MFLNIKLIDPIKVGFRDKCSKDTQRGIGIICGIYIVATFIGLISTVISTVLLFASCREDMDKSTTIKTILYSLIVIFFQIFIIIFIINACRMCNGLFAFLFILALGAVISIITRLLFKNVQDIIKKCVMDKLGGETKL